MFGHLGMISLINHDSSEGEQWGRYNLPRSKNHQTTDQKTIKNHHMNHHPKTIEKQPSLVGGFKHVGYFPFHIGIILPNYGYHQLWLWFIGNHSLLFIVFSIMIYIITMFILMVVVLFLLVKLVNHPKYIKWSRYNIIQYSLMGGIDKQRRSSSCAFVLND